MSQKKKGCENISKSERKLDLDDKGLLKDLTLELLFTIVTFVPIQLFNGWCLSLVWNWWIAPIFDITLSIIQGMGVSLVFAMLTFRLAEKQSNSSGWIQVVAMLFAKLVFVGASWLLHIVFT